MSTAVAYWTLCPSFWTTLVVGWFVVLSSVLATFQIQASGAVLVGCALISQMLFEQLRWRKLPCPPEGTFYLVPDGTTKKPIGQNPYCYVPVGSGRMGALLSLSPDHLIGVNEHRKEVTWFYRDVVHRAEKVFLASSITSAVLGTLLSGYGHLWPAA